MSPPAKRQRTEDAPIARSDIWHSDGSVVLQAENTQFRVHWSILGLSSPFFRDMQGLPQPIDQPSTDGCPIVQLSDTAVDVQFLLEALYTPTFLAEAALPFAAVASLIRLGRKYEFRDLFNSALGRLTFENPTSLEEYRALPSQQVGEWKHYTPTRIIPCASLCFDTVTLAIENNLWSILPCACLRLVLWNDAHGLFDGFSTEDGTITSLSLVHLRRCIAGREQLLTMQCKPGYILRSLQNWQHAKCARPTKCPLDRDTYITIYLETIGILTEEMLVPLRGSLCTPCFQGAEKLISAGWKKMWEELPGVFDLPPWAELKDDP
ncbi:hypothetical protein C8R46DRAFT_934712 [Mycena filopes]|nr:hypothetical protein C8R46DRAFT_934712 [Mycena filopes]